MSLVRSKDIPENCREAAAARATRCGAQVFAFPALDGQLHHIRNAYVASPALFPTLGSANPSLTALTLPR